MELLPPPPGIPLDNVLHPINDHVTSFVRKPSHLSPAVANHLDPQSSASPGTATNMLRRGPRMSSLGLGTVHCHDESDNAMIDISANSRVATPVDSGFGESDFSKSKTTVETSNTDVVLVVSEEHSEAVNLVSTHVHVQRPLLTPSRSSPTQPGITCCERAENGPSLC